MKNVTRYPLQAARSRGFTLVELLVVIAIIGILAVVVVAALGQARKSARDSKKAETTRNTMTAVETYYSVEGDLPADLDEVVTKGYLTVNPITGGEKYVKSYTPAAGSYCILSADYETKTGNFYAKDGSSGFSEGGVCP